jgi:hypothetical protein
VTIDRAWMDRRGAWQLFLIAGGRFDMSRFHDKAEGHTKQMIGQMIGDEQLVRDGKQQVAEPGGGDTGQHSDHGIVEDEKAEEQPKDRKRAQTIHKVEPRQHGLPPKENIGSEGKAETRR